MITEMVNLFKEWKVIERRDLFNSSAHFSAISVLFSTIVIVNGPTPPGTGVIARRFLSLLHILHRLLICHFHQVYYQHQ